MPDPMRTPGKVALVSLFVAAVGLGSSLYIKAKAQEPEAHNVTQEFMDGVGTIGLIISVISGGQWAVRRRKQDGPAPEPSNGQ